MADEFARLQLVDEFVADRLELVQFGRAIERDEQERDQQDALEGDDRGEETAQVRLAKVVTETHSRHGNCCEPQHVQIVRVVLEGDFKLLLI